LGAGPPSLNQKLYQPPDLTSLRLASAQAPNPRAEPMERGRSARGWFWC